MSLSIDTADVQTIYEQLRQAKHTIATQLSETDKLYGLQELAMYLDGARREFDLAASALTTKQPVWEARLRDYLVPLTSSSSLTESPVLDYCHEVIKKADWETLQVIELYYPDLDVLGIHSEHCAALQYSFGAIATTRAAIEHAFLSLEEDIRNTLIDVAVGKLTGNDAAELLIAQLESGFCAIENLL